MQLENTIWRIEPVRVFFDQTPIIGGELNVAGNRNHMLKLPFEDAV